MNIKFSKKINIICFLLVILVIYAFMRPFYTCYTLYGDSLSWPWYTENGFWLPFLQNDHTWFVYSAFYCLCNRFLPLLLNLHPQMFYKYCYSFIMFGYYLCFFLAMRGNFTKYSKAKYGVLWTLAIFPIAMQALTYSGFLWAPKNDTFTLPYVFLTTFFILLANMFEKIYVKDLFAQTSKREWITLLVLFAIVSISHEFPKFIICMGGIIGFFLHYFFVNKNFNKKRFWAIYGLILASNLVLFLTPNFQLWFTERDNHLSIASFIADLPHMASAYFQTVIIENWLYLAVLAVLLVFFKFTVKNLTEKRKLFVWTMSILVSIFAFSLVIVIGSENYEYSFMHPGIRFLSKIFMLNLIFSLTGYLLSYDCGFKKKATALAICFLPLLCSIQRYTLDCSFFEEEIYQARYRAYLLERFFLVHEKPAKVYYKIQDKIFFEKNSLRYYLFLYDRNHLQADYQEKNLCEPTDTFEDCNKIITDILKKEHNFEFSKEELDKLDFNIYKKYYDF